MRGQFITFEGGEGTGKSTQAETLAQRLRTLGIDVLLTREPGGSVGAEIVRHVILSGAAKPLGPEAEAMLFAAARLDHVEQTIRPALERGTWVISDRFIDSTRAYQGALGNVDPRIIRGLERLAVGGTVPNLTIVLDAPPLVGLERAASRRGATAADRFETEAAEFHTGLREAYRDIVAANPGRCVLIDAARVKKAVSDDVWKVVAKRFGPLLVPARLAVAKS